MADLDEYLHNLNQIQRKWVYLEPIFGRGALPREQGRFKRVDDDFRFVSTCVCLSVIMDIIYLTFFCFPSFSLILFLMFLSVVHDLREQVNVTFLPLPLPN